LLEGHLRESGFALKDVVVKGMQDCPEFARIVLEGGRDLDPEKLRREVRAAAEEVRRSGAPIDMVVLECPNLITFRSEIQQALGVPVFDVVTLIDFFASAYRLKAFPAAYL
jgi:Asp/Glu/hydantoin racemase